MALIATMAAQMLTTMIQSKLQKGAQNAATAANYNNQARYAERVNQAALNQQAANDALARMQTMNQKQGASDAARSNILATKQAEGTALASAGTAGIMGQPLHMIVQNYESMIGNAQANLTQFNQNSDKSLFLQATNNALQAQSATNQAIPQDPYFLKFGGMDWLNASASALNAGLSAKQTQSYYKAQANYLNPGLGGSGSNPYQP